MTPTPERPAEPAAPDCYRCAHFFVTYERAWPYGCRFFQLKARTLPSIEVQKSSGRPCQAWAPRNARPPRSRQDA